MLSRNLHTNCGQRQQIDDAVELYQGRPIPPVDGERLLITLNPGKRYNAAYMESEDLESPLLSTSEQSYRAVRANMIDVEPALLGTAQVMRLLAGFDAGQMGPELRLRNSCSGQPVALAAERNPALVWRMTGTACDACFQYNYKVGGGYFERDFLAVCLEHPLHLLNDADPGRLRRIEAATGDFVLIAQHCAYLIIPKDEMPKSALIEPLGVELCWLPWRSEQ